MHNFQMILVAVLLCLLCPAGQTAWANEAEQVASESVEEASPTYVGWLELSGTLREGPVPYAWITEAEAGPSLDSVLGQIETVATDDAYAGLVIFLDQPMLSLAQSTALRKGIHEARRAGKRVLCFAEAYGTLDYYLASAADLILLQNKGEVALNGLGVEEMYLAGMLEKIGLKADLIQVGKFKGADETWTRT